ncbi:hypothetical protein MMC17_007802 [Xylographa soralifera]|nr:hypothetical protein [Xylographa soralifera]
MEFVLTAHPAVIHDRCSGFTPVRRRVQVLPAQSPAVFTAAPWTTTRCNRLLRPLSSRVALLRKRKELQIQRLCDAEAAMRDDRAKSLSKPKNEVGLFQALFQPQSSTTEDPDWTPENVPRKRLKRTYSSKSCMLKERGSESRAELGAAGVPAVSKIQIPAVSLHITKGFETYGLDGSGPEYGITSKEHVEKDAGEAGTNAPSILRRKSSSIQSFTRDSFRKLAKFVSPSEWMLQDGLYTGLEALLKATKKGTPRQSEGARSLFSTCLRHVPAYIAGEQHWVDQEDDETDIDVALNTYVDLESFSSAENSGWKPLREVARAHGITIIGDGIRDGSVGPAIARGLIILCLQASAYDEAEALMKYMLTRLGPIATPSTPSDGLFIPQTSIALQTLWEFSNQTERRGFLFSQMNFLLSTKIIPVEWIASLDMVSCWNHVVVSITQQDSYANEAVALLRTAVALSCGSGSTSKACQIHEHRLWSQMARKDSKIRPRAVTCMSKSDRSLVEDKHLDRANQKAHQLSAALTNTISNLLTVLLSITIVSWEQRHSNISLAHGLTRDVLLALALESNECETASYNIRTSTGHSISATRLCLPLLANIISIKSFELIAKSRQDQMDHLDLLARMTTKVRLTDELASFLCATAHCSEQAGTRTAFHYMQDIVTWLFDLGSSTSGNHTAEQGLEHLAVQAALEFAEQTNERDHLDWALEIEESVDLRVPESHLQHGSRSTGHVIDKQAAGFRWEEGICEWVAKTPAPTQRQTAVYFFPDEHAVTNESIGPEQEVEHILGKTMSPLQSKRRPTLCKASRQQPVTEQAGSTRIGQQFQGTGLKDRHCRARCSSENKRALLALRSMRGGHGDTAPTRKPSRVSGCSVANGFEGEVDELIDSTAPVGAADGQRRHLLDVTNQASGLARAAMQCGNGTGARERRSSTLSLQRRRRRTTLGKRCRMGQENVSEDELAI